VLALLADFPFAAPREVSESAWLAAALTIVARSAIDGPVPLTLIDAREKGSGKTLLQLRGSSAARSVSAAPLLGGGRHSRFSHSERTVPARPRV